MGLVTFDDSGGADFEFYVDILKNGASLIDQAICIRNEASVGYWSEYNFSFMVTLALNDYIQLEVENPNADSGDIIAGASHGWAPSGGGTFLTAMLVGA